MIVSTLLSLLIFTISSQREPVLSLSLTLNSNKDIETTFAIGNSQVRGSSLRMQLASISTMPPLTSVVRIVIRLQEESFTLWPILSNKTRTTVVRAQQE